MEKYNPQYWINYLNLLPHPEGGYYQRSYESNKILTKEDLKLDVKGPRKLFTSIYFLLRSDDISHLHRLKSDELWYYHAGSPLTIHVIDEKGEYSEVKLGLSLEKGEVPQYLVPRNCIFGSSVMEKNSFSLVGCMVSPGFDFDDFELFSQEELLNQYPQHKEIIEKLAYNKVPR